MSHLTSNTVEEFIKQVESIANAWQTTLSEYNRFIQEMKTIVLELGPSFGEGGQ